MGILNALRRIGFFAKSEKPELPEFRGRKLRKLGTIQKNKYEAICVLEYNGVALRQFPVTESGYSRDKVQEKIEENFKVKVAKIHQIKKK